MRVGESVKIFMPGESPWAEVEEIISDTELRVRIDNYLVCTGYGHPFKYNDVVRVELRVQDIPDIDREVKVWELAEDFDESKQKSMGDNPAVKEVWDRWEAER